MVSGPPGSFPSKIPGTFRFRKKNNLPRNHCVCCVFQDVSTDGQALVTQERRYTHWLAMFKHKAFNGSLLTNEPFHGTSVTSMSLVAVVYLFPFEDAAFKMGGLLNSQCYSHSQLGFNRFVLLIIIISLCGCDVSRRDPEGSLKHANMVPSLAPHQYMYILLYQVVWPDSFHHCVL